MSSRSASAACESTANPHDIHRVLINVQWILRLRWVAVVGQLTTILFAQWALKVTLPTKWLLPILAVTVGTNVAAYLWVRGQWLSVPNSRTLRQGNIILVAIILLDLVSLTGLLYLSGGTTNPFCVFYLVNFALAAMVVSEKWAWTIVAIGLLGLAFLTFSYQPISKLQPSGILPPSAWQEVSAPVAGAHSVGLLQAGVAVGVGLCGVVVVYFVRRVMAALEQSEARRRLAEHQRARSERLESLGTLAAGAGHELNTPLSTIAVVSKELARELSGRDDLPESVAQDALLIRSEVDRCRNILNRLSVDSGRSAGEPLVEATVAQLIDEVLQELRSPDRIDVAVQAGVSHRTVFVPLVSLSQALRGLVQNALDVTPDGDTVRLGVAFDQGQLHLQIEDQGPGMTPEVQSRAFEPFFTTKQPGDGMGLGLFLAQNTIERLGGRIELQSAVERGSLVKVWLPLA